MRIIPYDDQYRNEMISMVMQAISSLGVVPRQDDNLLCVQNHYIDCGDQFWLALDSDNSVIGCVGYNSIQGTTEARIRRLYVKNGWKHQGIGSLLLHTVEEGMRNAGKTASIVHLGDPKERWFESYLFYPKHGYIEIAPRYMRKDLTKY